MLQIVVLAVVQGLTEFLPVSSSGHLILVPHLTGWPDQGLMMDVAVHVGSLAAVLIYFWRDVLAMLGGLFNWLRGRRSPGARLAGQILLGTIPALIIGFLLTRYTGGALRQVQVVAWTMVVFAIVLWFADRYGMTINRLEHMSWAQALIIGLAQCLAFVPGTSRSGITMVAGRLMGYQRSEAARFSFLLSIPAIAAAGIWEGRHLLEPDAAHSLVELAWGIGLSALTALLAIAFMMTWLRRATFLPFVVYRLLLGAGLLIWVYAYGGPAVG